MFIQMRCSIIIGVTSFFSLSHRFDVFSWWLISWYLPFLVNPPNGYATNLNAKWISENKIAMIEPMHIYSLFYQLNRLSIRLSQGADPFPQQTVGLIPTSVTDIGKEKSYWYDHSLHMLDMSRFQCYPIPIRYIWKYVIWILCVWL